MSLYRCVFCGSPNVERSDRSEFSYKKGLVGTAVFGGIGAVAGINGKDISTFRCHDCGKESDHPMDSNEKMIVETMLSSRIEIPEYLLKYPYLRNELEMERAKVSKRDSYYDQIESNDGAVDSGQPVIEELLNNLLSGLNVQLPIDKAVSGGLSEEEIDSAVNNIGNALSGLLSQKGKPEKKPKK